MRKHAPRDGGFCQVKQLVLPFPVPHWLTDATFVRGEANACATTWLANPSTWPNNRLALHGPAGAGKTHLLHAFAERHAGILLPGQAIRYLPNLPDSGPIAIDDADLAPDPETLLHLLNAAAEARLPLLLAARTPPSTWPTFLPDLASRLRAITTAALTLPDDAMLAALLNTLATQHQLRLDPAVQTYLLARLPRDAASLREAACRLDRASLAHGRRVSRTLAAEVLLEMGAEGGDACEEGSKQAVLF